MNCGDRILNLLLTERFSLKRDFLFAKGPKHQEMRGVWSHFICFYMKASKTKRKVKWNKMWSFTKQLFCLWFLFWQVWPVFTKLTDKGAKLSTLTSESTNQTERFSGSSSSSTTHSASRRRVHKEKKLLVERFINVCKAFIPFLLCLNRHSGKKGEKNAIRTQSDQPWLSGLSVCSWKRKAPSPNGTCGRWREEARRLSVNELFI